MVGIVVSYFVSFFLPLDRALESSAYWTIQRFEGQQRRAEQRQMPVQRTCRAYAVPSRDILLLRRVRVK